MLPKKIKLTNLVLNLVFTFTKNPKNKESLKLLFLISVFLFLIISPGAAASSSWELTPQNPVAGDIIEIKGTGFEGETAKALVSFEKEVEVQGGEYEYLLEDVIIPSSSYNSFTVQAVGADDLNMRAKKLLWLTKSAEAKDGTATVSQTNVPPGTYKIRIDGKASGSNVKLKITAMQEVEVDSDGSLSYLYSTKSIPAGNFEVNIGGITKQIELKPSESLPSETNSSEQNSSEEKDNESLGSEINSSEQNSSEVKVYNWTNSLGSQEAKTEIEVYNWTDIQGNKSIIPEIKAEKNSWNNMKFILSYPYSLRSFYTVNESVKLSYIGPEALGQKNVNIYLIKEHSPGFPENVTSNGTDENAISLKDLLNNTESYIQIPATLNEGGDLSPLTLGPLQAGSYWILMTLAGNETVNSEPEKEILLAKYFEVLEYEMEAGAPYTVEEGENLEVNLRLKNAPAEKKYIYWAVLIKDSAYTASEGTNLRWRMTTGIRPIVNGVDLIKSLETSLRGYESENGKDELKNEVQTLIGEDNGTISIGEKNQSNLSLKSLELPQGDYLLLTGAYENSEGMVGISQKKLRISPEDSYGLNLESSSGKYLQWSLFDEIQNISAYGN